jgi:hypothetical protein
VGAELRRDKPEELCALLDVMLLGDFLDGRETRLVEYLVTMLCVEDEAGRRSQVAAPSELTPALSEVSRRMLAAPGIDVAAAVTRLEAAMQDLVRTEDHLGLRDEIRGFKQELGTHLLHPQILAAAVSYNVAMANQVSARLDTALALDELAEDLLAELKQPEAGDADLLHGSGMTQLVNALRARVCGTSSDGEPAARIVAAFQLDGLVAREVEAIESSEEDGLDPLIVSAVVLGCVFRQRSAMAEPLKAIGLDPEELESEALPALLREIGAAASKFFGESRYDEAFLLSAVKTRNLTAVHAAVGRRGRAAGGTSAVSSNAGSHQRLPLGQLVRRVGQLVGPILGLLLGWVVFGPGDNEVHILTPSELSESSPFSSTETGTSSRTARCASSGTSRRRGSTWIRLRAGWRLRRSPAASWSWG